MTTKNDRPSRAAMIREIRSRRRAALHRLHRGADELILAGLAAEGKTVADLFGPEEAMLRDFLPGPALEEMLDDLLAASLPGDPAR
jgi:hypothetical protein